MYCRTQCHCTLTSGIPLACCSSGIHLYFKAVWIFSYHTNTCKKEELRMFSSFKFRLANGNVNKQLNNEIFKIISSNLPRIHNFSAIQSSFQHSLKLFFFYFPFILQPLLICQRFVGVRQFVEGFAFRKLKN